MNDRDRNGAAGKRPTTDEYLREVTIGEPRPLNGPIHLAPHDPDWPSRFNGLASRIFSALPGKVLVLEHVGSTSVPRLSAKPVIDIVLAVPNSADEPSYVPALQQRGFALTIREPNWFEHRLLKATDIESNLHVFSAGCEEIGRILAFRDWLRSHDEDRRRYEQAKRELAARTWKHVQDYADAKTTIIEEILARAGRSSFSSSADNPS
jgi:GrpB-like predicted nucleotidyltransferase (UPF0157 family)